MATNYKLAIIDLDGTLLGPDKKASTANLLAVSYLCKIGMEVVLASGRTLNSMLFYHRLLSLRGDIVAYNGGLVINPMTKVTCCKQLLSATVTKQLIVDGLLVGATVVSFMQDKIAATRWHPWMSSTYCDDIIAWENGIKKFDASYKIMWIVAPECTRKLFNEIQTLYESLNIVITAPGFIEFLPQASDKSIALTVLASYLDISLDQICAFGDGANDVSMLKCVGLSIAMSNACTEAKVISTIVAPDGDPSQSLARAINHVFLSSIVRC